MKAVFLKARIFCFWTYMWTQKSGNHMHGINFLQKEFISFFGCQSIDENFDLILSFSTFWCSKTILAFEIVSLSKVVNDWLRQLFDSLQQVWWDFGLFICWRKRFCKSCNAKSLKKHLWVQILKQFKVPSRKVSHTGAHTHRHKTFFANFESHHAFFNIYGEYWQCSLWECKIIHKRSNAIGSDCKFWKKWEF